MAALSPQNSRDGMWAVNPVACGRLADLLPQPAVGRHPAHKGHVGAAFFSGGTNQLVGEHVHHRLLEPGRDVGNVLGKIQVGLDVAAHSGLDAAEAEIEIRFCPGRGVRNRIRCGSPCRASPSITPPPG